MYTRTSQTNTYFLFGVSAKHFSDDVSTTVSQNATTGSDTFISECKRKAYNKMCSNLSQRTYTKESRVGGTPPPPSQPSGGMYMYMKEHVIFICSSKQHTHTPSRIFLACKILTNFRVHLPQVMHDTIQKQFSSTKHHMLP